MKDASEPLLAAEIAELERIAQLATAAPWQYGTDNDGLDYLIGCRGLLWGKVAASPERNAEADALLIVMSRNLMPRLPATLRTLTAEVEQGKKDVEGLNRMLREHGYGQGTIDTYVAQCEEMDGLTAEVERLRVYRECTSLVSEIVQRHCGEFGHGTIGSEDCCAISQLLLKAQQSESEASNDPS